jgi:hypothetical protein
MLGFGAIGKFAISKLRETAVAVATSRAVLQDPINCVLAGQQPYRERGREWEIHPPNRRTKTAVTRSGVRQLGGQKPSFTTKTSKRGYD